MVGKVFIASLLTSLAAAQGTQDLNAVLSGNKNLSSLASLIQSQPAIQSALASASNITVLAPDNNAISKFLNASGGQAAVVANTGLVQALLQYHVLNGTWPAASFGSNPLFIPSLLTNGSYTNVTGGQRVEGATAGNNVGLTSGLGANSTVVQADQNFTSGVVHVIDTVLTIPTNISDSLLASGLSSLYGALTQAKLIDTVEGLKDVTIFAPNNDAFKRVGSALENASADTVSDVLKYHVVSGGTPFYSTALKDGGVIPTIGNGSVNIHITGNNVFVNGAKVIKPNLLVGGGVVHVIDNVLNPANPSASPSASATAGAAEFSGASSASNVPFTSGVPAARTTAAGAQTTTTTSSSSNSKGAAVPMATQGVMGAAALFGAGAAMLANL